MEKRCINLHYGQYCVIAMSEIVTIWIVAKEIIHRLRHLPVGRQRINLSGTVINMRKINYIGYGFKNGALTWSLSAYTINRFINHN